MSAARILHLHPAPPEAPSVLDLRTLRRLARHNSDLSHPARLLFEDLCDLSEGEGYSKAGDKHFATVYGVDRRTVRRWMNELRDAGLIRVEGATKNRRVIPQEPAALETPNPEPSPQLRTPDVLGHRTPGVLNGADLGHSASGDLGHSRDDSKSIYTPRGEEGESPAPAAFDPVADFSAAFPSVSLNHYQVSLLARMTDREAFGTALHVWAGSDYKPWNIIGFQDRYRKIQKGETGADGHKPSPEAQPSGRTAELPDLTAHAL